MTEHPFMRTLNERFGGRIAKGQHEPDGEGCAIEIESVARGRQWSDGPITLPDLRPLNDAFEDDGLRTQHMSAVVVALWDWPEWTQEQRQRFAEIVAIRTVREILPWVPVLLSIALEESARQCAEAQTCQAAAEAAKAATRATEAAARTSSCAAEAATRAARTAPATGDTARTAAEAAARTSSCASEAATWATARTAEDQILINACCIWIEAAEEVRG